MFSRARRKVLVVLAAVLAVASCLLVGKRRTLSIMKTGQGNKPLPRLA